jgi:hypothetical protein
LRRFFGGDLALAGEGKEPATLGGPLDLANTLPLGMLGKTSSNVALDPIII